MSGEGSSELPQFYGGKTSDGEIVKRPHDGEVSPLSAVTSPTRVYHPGERPISPERGVIESDNEGGRIGLRRRPSASGMPNRAGDYDVRRSTSTRRPLRAREEAHWDEGEYDRSYRQDPYHHPDERTNRPPRTHRNYEKPFYEETRSDYPLGDVPRTPSKRHRRDGEGSVDGYNYHGPHHHEKPVSFKELSKEERAEVTKLPWIAWMNSEVKNHFVATVGEFIGTTMFLFFAFAGACIANATTTGSAGFNVTVILYISLVFGFSLMVNVWIFFRISGGLFNPAVTLGMVLVGAIPPVRAVCLVGAQLAGGVAASGMVMGLFPVEFNVQTGLGGGATMLQGVLIEALLTAELVFTIFMLAKEKHKATFLAPVGIGLALFIAQMVGIYYTGGSLNPARSFGPALVTTTFKSEHWIYWVGPSIGALVAVAFYKFIKMLEYEMANPGQDGDPLNDPTQNEEKLADILQTRRRA